MNADEGRQDGQWSGKLGPFQRWELPTITTFPG